MSSSRKSRAVPLPPGCKAIAADSIEANMRWKAKRLGNKKCKLQSTCTCYAGVAVSSTITRIDSHDEGQRLILEKVAYAPSDFSTITDKDVIDFT